MTDFNNYRSPGVYYTGADTLANGPTPYAWGILLVYGSKTSLDSLDYTIQVFVSLVANTMHEPQIRAYNGVGWIPWKKIPFET